MHLLLVDGSTFIFRAYHALPPLTRKSDGLPIGAVSGFCNMLFKLVDNFKNGQEPTHMAVIFDHKGKTFRNDFYPEYKAHRPPAPEDLVPQFPLTREATKAFSISSVEQEGYEADDLIATYAIKAKQAGGRVTIISTDKDLMQLIDKDGQIKMFDSLKDRTIGFDEVKEKFGVTPDKVIEVQSLAGDSVDNIPGVPGIGIKTAALLINEFGDLETLLARASEIKQNKRRENLIEFADQARVSHRLVTLKQDVPVEHELEDFARQPIEAKFVLPFLKAMEFNTIARRIANSIDADVDAYDADAKLAANGNSSSIATDLPFQASDEGNSDVNSKNTPLKFAQDMVTKISDISIDYEKYQTITNMHDLQIWIDKIQAKGHVAIDTETTGLDNQKADLVGISLAVEIEHACYIPLGHIKEQKTISDQADIFGEDDIFAQSKISNNGLVEGQLELTQVIDALKPILQDASILKILQNAKYDMGILSRYGINIIGFDDTMLLSYAIDGARGNSMDALSERWLGHKPTAFKDIAGVGKKQISFEKIEIDVASKYAAEDADITLRLWYILKARLVAKKATNVYETLERPLVGVLARMEARGISLDRKMLARLSGEFAQRAAAMQAIAFEMAGEEFNLGSPKQLGEILFNKMGLKGGKKTKTGAWQTGVSVLEDLAANDVPLAKVILDWRAISKLKSTYSDALPNFINSRTGRVHTSYHQAAVITGRLSSSDPNLQNIPIRSEDGRKIRTAFIAANGKSLISADYSQIELRILAHIADIAALKKAFADGLDIHAMTASEIFNVPIKDMDANIRRNAKAINFGIIYGISAFGLANQLGISRTEASDYIKAYFEKFPGIKDYMEVQKSLVKEQGFVETIFGRKIILENANSKNPMERAFVERVSINAPIQGSAADIIRRAMIHMEPALKDKKIEADMLLQVHDELIFEVAKGDEEKSIKAISDIMSHAAEPAVQLSVPLIIDAKAANNWNDAH